MARVTVEDCVLRVPNRFDLVLLAAQRSREVTSGAALTVERDNDKNPVVALREIADGTVETDDLRSSVIQSLQRHVEVDEPEEDEFDSLSSEVSAELSGMMAQDKASTEGLSVQDDAEDLDDASVKDEDIG